MSAAASAQSPGGLARHAMVGTAVEALGGDSAGVRVAAVMPGFTAAGLDLRPGDVVLEVDGALARGEHEPIVRMVNARRPGTAELAVLENIDHGVMRYPDRERSFRGEGGTVGPEALDAMLRWLERRRRE